MTVQETRADDAAAELEFVTTRVTPTETAAVSAVLRGLRREESDGRRAEPAAARSAWRAGQRALRSPTPGAGQWRGFTG